MCLHNWRSVCNYLGLRLGDNDRWICSKCGLEGIDWYDGLSGGISRSRRPTTDLRIQNKLNYG